jgi:hypothetical protein
MISAPARLPWAILNIRSTEKTFETALFGLPARGGESRRDFASKCAISLKEAREARFRLRVAVATRLGPVLEAQALADEAEELAAILGAIVRNARKARCNPKLSANS